MTLGISNLNQRRRAAAIGLSAGIGAVVLIALLLSLRLTVVAAPGATTWYVHPNGSDSDTGTLGLPFATIQHAIDVASDGDTILVAAGTYTENLVITETLTLRGGHTISGALWLPRTGETIIDGSNNQTVEGDWDGRGVHVSTVISDDGVYKMWYQGWGLMSRGFGLATSPDGIAWTKHAGNPVFTATVDWEEGGMGQPHVIKDGTTYKMWYGSNGEKIGYAESSDGIHWTKYADNPILEGTPGTWEEKGVGAPFVIKVGSDDYRIWYQSSGQIGYAASTNGITWTKHISPVLSPGSSGEWDDERVADPNVLFDGMTYHMWYAGYGGDAFHIGYASSSDGINWNKSASNPLLSPGAPGEWDEGTVSEPNVLFDGVLYRMWFSGCRDGWQAWQRGYATSSNGITWTKSLSNPVLSPGTLVQQWGQPVVTLQDGSDGSVLDGFTITAGEAEEAGGVHAGSADVTIRDCLIRDNFADGSPYSYAGGGVLGGVADDGQVTIIDTRIVNNRVNEGASGVRVHGDTLVMVNTLIADNYDAEGVHLNGSATLTNVTVAHNGAGTGRPGINYNPGTGENLVIVNSIVYGNGTGDAFHVPDPGTIQASYSDIQGGWAGTGNIDADPQFVDVTNGDYHLKPGSPCIDAGTSVDAPAADIEGTPRDAAPDMGAYEWTGFRIFLPLVLRNS